MFIRDVNGDGRGEVIVAMNSNPGMVNIFMNHGDGTFAPAVSYGTGIQPVDVVFADIDLDGKADMIAACFSGHVVSVLKGNGNGTFQAAANYADDGPASIFWVLPM